MIIIGLLIGLLIIKIISDTFFIKIRYYQLQNKKINVKKDKNIDGLRIIYFSDLHIGRSLKKKSFYKIMNKLNKFNADIYIFGGDLFGENTLKYYSIEDISQGFLKLIGKCVLAVYGNHEYYNTKELPLKKRQQIYKQLPFKILKDEMFVFKKNNLQISIYGLDDAYHHQIDSYKINADLIISHEGDIIDEFNQQIMLSGHTHGGQIRLPLFPLLYKPKYGKKYRHGLFNIKNNQLLVSNGIGFSRIKLRLFAKREIILIDYK